MMYTFASKELGFEPKIFRSQSEDLFVFSEYFVIILSLSIEFWETYLFVFCEYFVIICSLSIEFWETYLFFEINLF